MHNTHKHTHKHEQIIGHWSSPAPELKLLPAQLIPVAQDIVETHMVRPQDVPLICQHSRGFFLLLAHDQKALELEISSPVAVSQSLVSLLTVMISKSKAGLTGKDQVVTRPWSCGMPPFEEMLRTASYGPCHPVFRQLPYFMYDHLNKQQVIRYAKNRQIELQQLRLSLAKQSVRMGTTCNKFKTKNTSLTSGVFTIFCNSCSILEYFELMCRAESPATPARALFHRVWRDVDKAAHDAWLASNHTQFDDPVKPFPVPV